MVLISSYRKPATESSQLCVPVLPQSPNRRVLFRLSSLFNTRLPLPRNLMFYCATYRLLSSYAPVHQKKNCSCKYSPNQTVSHTTHIHTESSLPSLPSSNIHQHQHLSYAYPRSNKSNTHTHTDPHTQPRTNPAHLSISLQTSDHQQYPSANNTITIMPNTTTTGGCRW